jgi:hypothetical protein
MGDEHKRYHIFTYAPYLAPVCCAPSSSCRRQERSRPRASGSESRGSRDAHDRYAARHPRVARSRPSRPLPPWDAHAVGHPAARCGGLPRPAHAPRRTAWLCHQSAVDERALGRHDRGSHRTGRPRRRRRRSQRGRLLWGRVPRPSPGDPGKTADWSRRRSRRFRGRNGCGRRSLPRIRGDASNRPACQ